MGRALNAVFFRGSGVEVALEDAGFRMFPMAYYSIVGFFFLLSLLVVVPVAVLTELWFILPLPLLVVCFGVFIPKIKTTDRAAKLDLEVPFAGAYISVMATGGLSPLRQLKAAENVQSAAGHEQSHRGDRDRRGN